MDTPGFLLMLNSDQEVSVKKAFNHVLSSRKLHLTLPEEWLPVTGLQPWNRARCEAADDQLRHFLSCTATTNIGDLPLVSIEFLIRFRDSLLIFIVGSQIPRRLPKTLEWHVFFWHNRTSYGLVWYFKLISRAMKIIKKFCFQWKLYFLNSAFSIFLCLYLYYTNAASLSLPLQFCTVKIYCFVYIFPPDTSFYMTWKIEFSKYIVNIVTLCI